MLMSSCRSRRVNYVLYVVGVSLRTNEIIIRQIPFKCSPCRRCAFKIRSGGFQKQFIVRMEYSPAIGMQRLLNTGDVTLTQLVPQRPGDSVRNQPYKRRCQTWAILDVPYLVRSTPNDNSWVDSETDNKRRHFL